MLNLHHGADDVEKAGHEPEDVVDVVHIVVEFIAVLPKADIMEIERVIREEV